MLSIVIPVYNEEDRIVPSLEAILAFFTNQELLEIVVVDDGSTDSTMEVIAQVNSPLIKTISYAPNKGKGHAVKQGMLEAQGEIILLTDSDLSTPIDEYTKLAKFAEKGRMVIGSRALERSAVTNKWYKIFLGWLGNKFIQLLLPGIRDTQCGFKVFHRKDIQQIAPLMSINGFGYDFELLFLGRKLGAKVVEVPVKWANAEGSKVRFYHYFTTLSELLLVALKNVTGKYRFRKGA